MDIIEQTEGNDTPNKLGRPQKYPWDKWLRLDGKKVRVYQDEDFDIEIGSMRPQIHLIAKRHGGKASTSVGREKDGERRRYIDIVFHPNTSENDFNFEKGPKAS